MKVFEGRAHDNHPYDAASEPAAASQETGNQNATIA